MELGSRPIRCIKHFSYFCFKYINFPMWSNFIKYKHLQIGIYSIETQAEKSLVQMFYQSCIWSNIFEGPFSTFCHLARLLTLMLVAYNQIGKRMLKWEKSIESSYIFADLLLVFSSLLIGLCNIQQLVAHVIRLVRYFKLIMFCVLDRNLKVDDVNSFCLQLSCTCWCLCLAYFSEVVPLSFWQAEMVGG